VLFKEHLVKEFWDLLCSRNEIDRLQHETLQDEKVPLRGTTIKSKLLKDSNNLIESQT